MYIATSLDVEEGTNQKLRSRAAAQSKPPMATLLLPLLFLIASPAMLLTRAAADASFPINVWPKPTSMSWAEPHAAVPVSPSFHIVAPSANPHLVSAAERYAKLLLTERYRPAVRPAVNVTAGSSAALARLTLAVSDPAAPLQHGVDESYTLEIPPAGGAATVTAATAWGAMRGLETLSQLAWRAGGRGSDMLLVAAGVRFEDRPIYPHRGLMLDTGRTYFPVADILRTIDAMAANKMNVFHWHITDSQSFPIELPSEPELAEKGAYGEDMRYTVEDVKLIVEFAMSRGVRVVPEIDSPGHTASWAGAYPEAVSCAGKFWLPGGDWNHRLAAEPGAGQLNPLSPKTYEVITNVVNDLTSLFPDGFYHAGADEVTPGCWLADPTIQAALERGATLSQLLERYVAAVHPLVVSKNRTAVFWEDVLLDSAVNVSSSAIPPATTILQTWNNGPNNTKLIVQAGYRAIVSSASFYYLDCGHGDFVGNNSVYDDPRSDFGSSGGSWCGPYKTWQRVYDYDIAYGLTAEEARLVIGGEVAMWTEQVDAAVLDGRVWPRASAMAEALWSGNRDAAGRKRYAEATDRLTDWRNRMVGRGVRAEPIQPLWCRTRPGMCNPVQ